MTGGSSAINGQVFLRGVPEHYHAWAAMGNAEWHFENCFQYFRKIEADTDFGAYDFHRADGPTEVHRFQPQQWRPEQHAFYNACRAVGFSDSPDHTYPGILFDATKAVAVEVKSGGQPRRARVLSTSPGEESPSTRRAAGQKGIHRHCVPGVVALKCLLNFLYSWLYLGGETVKLRKRSRGALHVVCLAFLVPMMAGCATSASLRPTHRDGILGTPGYYASTPQAVFQAAQQAAQELGFTVTESAPDQAYFIARRGMRGGDWGGLLGVYLTNTIDHLTLIIVRSDPAFAANLNQGDDTTLLHASLRHKLENP